MKTLDETRTQNINEELVRQIIRAIGDDETREGLVGTPFRVVESWKELFSGYTDKVSDHMTLFEKSNSDEMVVLSGIEFQSTCEHHMLPFIGTASIGYIPDKHIIGISKLVRILNVYAKRLQIQERLTTQVSTALMNGLEPLGVGVVLKATHQCMTCRGVKQHAPTMITSSLLGVFRDKPEVRQEFLSFVK